MIRYALKCGQNHEFESWFATAEAFDRLRSSGMILCPVCNSDKVEKALMTPGVRPARTKAQPPIKTSDSEDRPASLKEPTSEVEAKLAKLRQHVEKNSDYVGLSFVTEARKMHDGEIPHRSIYGEARSDEARKLVEDGVPVAPLPFLPSRKAN